MSKKVLITGASGGFGRLTVNTLLAGDYKVAATMREIDGKNKDIAQELSNAGALVVELDVTSEESVNAGINKGIQALGGIDVVINNAGVGVSGMMEHFTTNDFQRIFEVNVFGVQRVNRAVLPHLRKQKSGLLIHISSLLGRVTLPFWGPYNGSKWALEAMAEGYRYELSGFGVDSCIIEPGGFPTEIFEKLITPSDKSQEESYGEFMNVPKTFSDGFAQAMAENSEQDPQLVAGAILNLIETRPGKRPLRTVVDKMGMGEFIDKYNEQLENITSELFKASQIEQMLNLKV